MAVSLDSSEMSRLDDIIARGKPLSKGQQLVAQGAPFKFVFAIKTGSVKTVNTNSNGDAQITGFYFPGDLIGLNAIDTGICQDTVSALETTTVCQIQFEQLDDLSAQLPKLRRQILKTMSKNLCNEQHMLQLLANKNADQRIATFLLRLSNRFKARGFSACRFRLSMSRNEIGNYLGITVETVSRVLSRLQKNGYIGVENKEIDILNFKALLKLSQESA
ncbi:MAG: fumarate/nitrate reduction transcriptional regulator Fnr [Pseudomonadales bacterium]|nr:fumarate/nitrate reduction transcriptional regulator Fnr [Pseudomonadales bacterium]